MGPLAGSSCSCMMRTYDEYETIWNEQTKHDTDDSEPFLFYLTLSPLPNMNLAIHAILTIWHVLPAGYHGNSQLALPALYSSARMNIGVFLYLRQLMDFFVGQCPDDMTRCLLRCLFFFLTYTFFFLDHEKEETVFSSFFFSFLFLTQKAPRLSRRGVARCSL